MQLLRVLGVLGKFKQSAGERGSRSIARVDLVNHSVLNLYSGTRAGLTFRR